MRSLIFALFLGIGGALAQFPGSAPWGKGHNRQPFGKPSRPSPFSRPMNYGKPATYSSSQFYDPIPPNPNLDDSYDSHQLPAKLPLLAPNGVVEIYNRVVDDLIKKLEVSFRRREIDPMNVVIRPTPTTPVRVPGYLQKRPFRRPGAPLYRSNGPMGPLRRKHGKSNPLPDEPEENKPKDAEEQPSFRGAGKISKEPLGPEPLVETTPVTVVIIPQPETTTTESTPELTVLIHDDKSIESSEEPMLFRTDQSDEYFSDEIEEELRAKETTEDIDRSGSELKKKSKKDETEEFDDEVEPEGRRDVESLLKRYQSKHTYDAKLKTKYTAGGSKKKDGGHGGKKKNKDKEQSEELDEDLGQDEDDEIHDEMEDGGPSGGDYGFYGGPGRSKPNAQMTGLSKIKRASDVVVNVDARSAIITARLLVGPIEVNINDSVEPMERNVRATIPELEAEMIMMERHGVVFLQRFTMDRAYGQDIEISMPKLKKDTKNSNKVHSSIISHSGTRGPGSPPGMDPNQVQRRFQTKMAAHISMEVVKILRSNNLRTNMMRIAQTSMSKLKLPIKKSKKKSKKTKKSKEDY